MAGSPRPEEGDEYTVERTFTTADVRTFGELSGDRQAIHTEPDEEGRLVVQGLLTGTLPTAIGADLQVLARRMDLEFVRPVYTGERITCTWTNDSVEPRDDGVSIRATAICTNEAGERVLEAEIAGVIRAGDHGPSSH
ncbi:MAG: dehydratase [Halodesulfurarchaeum sp.]